MGLSCRDDGVVIVLRRYSTDVLRTLLSLSEYRTTMPGLCHPVTTVNSYSVHATVTLILLGRQPIFATLLLSSPMMLKCNVQGHRFIVMIVGLSVLVLVAGVLEDCNINVRPCC